MEEDEVPKFRSWEFVHIPETARQKELRESYNWKITSEGWVRMDKKPPSTPPKNLPPLDFSGQCFDEVENVWTSCFQLEGDGRIESDDTFFHKVRSVAGNAEIDLDEVCLADPFCRLLAGLPAFPQKLTFDRLWAS